MKNLAEMESTCSRILSSLEHDDLRRSSLTTMRDILMHVRADLEKHVREHRVGAQDGIEVRLADDWLRTVHVALIWLQEYGEMRPLVDVAQRLRMAGLRILRVIAVLRTAEPEAAVSGPQREPSPLVTFTRADALP
jgi:hypothetical protein